LLVRVQPEEPISIGGFRTAQCLTQDLGRFASGVFLFVSILQRFTLFNTFSTILQFVSERY